MPVPSQASRGASGYFPINIRLADRPVLVVGGSRAALAEIRRLVEFGANVLVVAPHMVHEIQELAVTYGHKLQVQRRNLSLQDEDAIASHRYTLVIACSGSADQDEYVVKLANQSGTLVALPDNHEIGNEASFIIPAIRKRGHIKISVSTDGFSNALSRALLERIESSLGGRIDKYMIVLDAFREKIAALYSNDQLTDDERKHVLRRLAESEELILAFQRENFDEAIQLAELIISESKDPAAI